MLGSNFLDVNSNSRRFFQSNHIHLVIDKLGRGFAEVDGMTIQQKSSLFYDVDRDR